MTTKALRGYRPEPLNPKHWPSSRLGLSQATLGDVDLRPFTSPRHDQTSTNSCVAQAVVKALEINRVKALGPGAHVDLSVLAVYYLARELMYPPETTLDEGTYVSLACEVLRTFGVPAEVDWPYDLQKLCSTPSWQAMRKAYTNKITAYYRITSVGQDRVAEVAKAIRAGYPIVYGTSVGAEWLDYAGGYALGPCPEGEALGGHATVLLGVQGGNFIGENSWGCYDDKTEILTTQGWKSFYNLTENDVYVTLNAETHCLEFQKAKYLHQYVFDGYLLHFVHQGVDLLVTPNHRMYVSNHHKRHETNWPMIRADQIRGQNRKCFKKDAVNTLPDRTSFQVADTEILANTWLEFMGYFISEGWTSCQSFNRVRTRIRTRLKLTDGSNRIYSARDIANMPLEKILLKKTISYKECGAQTNYTVGICQNAGDKADVIRKCLGQLPFRFSERHMGKSIVWACHRKELYLHLHNLGKARKKYIPRELLCLSENQSRILFEALMLGDGSKKGGSWKYYTSSPQLADNVQELVLLCGFAGDIHVVDRTEDIRMRNRPKGPEYQIGIKQIRIRPEARYFPQKVLYQGNVYCVTVPNGLVYVRRNGQAVWCGNSEWGLDEGFYLAAPELVASPKSNDFFVITGNW